ncbi:hypothetical protein SJAG_01530 [Schizosaccharomyces japonicus yFS275]|uniref:AAA+ ATPase domain-containing protein n=1 Tax=Schizosaccharomyces japonicus (strain yFS275 / FY16936) TaxID=402676 RepID=B6JY71_SCHJY|nr:hypothetical protein SJAG_01530 [Schizosaccharomyces japonicus yFS275]EEB06489.1 hypothetical protein SJAG_01530 [Schizosaccharomyces japonicus yFS275]
MSLEDCFNRTQSYATVAISKEKNAEYLEALAMYKKAENLIKENPEFRQFHEFPDSVGDVDRYFVEALECMLEGLSSRVDFLNAEIIQQKLAHQRLEEEHQAAKSRESVSTSIQPNSQRPLSQDSARSRYLHSSSAADTSHRTYTRSSPSSPSPEGLTLTSRGYVPRTTLRPRSSSSSENRSLRPTFNSTKHGHSSKEKPAALYSSRTLAPERPQRSNAGQAALLAWNAIANSFPTTAPSTPTMSSPTKRLQEPVRVVRQPPHTIAKPSFASKTLATPQRNQNNRSPSPNFIRSSPVVKQTFTRKLTGNWLPPDPDLSQIKPRSPEKSMHKPKTPPQYTSEPSQNVWTPVSVSHPPPPRRPPPVKIDIPLTADADSEPTKEQPVKQFPVDGESEQEFPNANPTLSRQLRALKECPDIDQELGMTILREIVVEGDEVHWDDIAGLEDAKSSLKETVVYPFLRPDLFQGLREPARGMLLFGPPGTGKTMLARAVATESKSTFFSISASSLTSKFLGESEKLVRALFTLAKKLSPSIIFVDEIDSLLSARSSDGNEHETSRRIKTEFLIQWSSLASSTARSSDNKSRVLVLAATNLPWCIDEAARRRFVRRTYIPLPERETRKLHLLKLLRSQKHCLTDEEVEAIVDATHNYSGSDLMALAKDAAMGPLRSLGEDLLVTRMEFIRPIDYTDFTNSLKLIRPSVNAEGLQRFQQWNEEFGAKG